ncbi:hypothetical protein C8R44DRAFT_869244 [Mycena epipterygia]|nr:hypothetical protein C8R44DRAFT_869244 [Mycena epipterygia]
MYGTLPPDNSGSDSDVSDTSPNPTQSPTSLDFSLETPPHKVPSASIPLNEVINDSTMADEEETREKRKQPESGVSSTVRPPKQFLKFIGDELRCNVIHHEAHKVSDLTDFGTITQLLFIRQAMLEGSCRIEDILYFSENEWLVNIRNNTHQFTSCRCLRHPLLFNAEAAKLQVLHILLRQRHYYELAWILNDLLCLRFRDEYAITHLLNAGYIDFLTNDIDAGFYGTPTPESSDMEGVELGYPESVADEESHVRETNNSTQDSRVVPHHGTN